MFNQRTPAWPRALPQAARHPGCVLFGYFLLHKQEKVTRAWDARGKPNGRGQRGIKIKNWIPAFAGMTSMAGRTRYAL